MQIDAALYSQKCSAYTSLKLIERLGGTFWMLMGASSKGYGGLRGVLAHDATSRRLARGLHETFGRPLDRPSLGKLQVPLAYILVLAP